MELNTRTKGRTRRRKITMNKEEYHNILMLSEFHHINELLEEADISIACMMDDIETITKEDLEHIQDQLNKMIIKLMQIYRTKGDKKTNDK